MCHAGRVAVADPTWDLVDPVVAGDHPARPIWLIASVAVGVALVFGVAWAMPGINGNQAATILSILTAIVVVGVVFGLSKKLVPKGGRVHGLAVGATVIGSLVVVVGAWSGTITAMKMSADESAWLVVANQALAGLHAVTSCSTPPAARAEVPGVGRVENVCVLLAADFNGPIVSLGRTYPPTSGVLYVPDVANLKGIDTCAAHLNGPWFHFVPGSRLGVCPFGYAYIEGP
jgi:hypothetical protein